MQLEIRKTVSTEEEWLIEGGKAVGERFRMVCVAAVAKNPWQGFVDDLQPVIHANARELADLLVSKALALIGGPARVEAFGKAGVVGTSGEVEHAAAFIHTLHFGNRVRDAVEGTSFMPFSNRRGAPGCTVTIPLKHKIKEHEGSRAHFLTADMTIADAPGPDELVIAIALATGGRPHHRIGDRYQDARDLSR